MIRKVRITIGKHNPLHFVGKGKWRISVARAVKFTGLVMD
jgi:hypothetical protein